VAGGFHAAEGLAHPLEAEAFDGLVEFLEACGVVVEAQLGQHLALGTRDTSDVEGLGYVYADVDVHGSTPSSC